MLFSYQCSWYITKRSTFRKPRWKYGHPYAQQIALSKERWEEFFLCWASQHCCNMWWQEEGFKSSGKLSKSFESSCLSTPHAIKVSMVLKVIRCQKLHISPYKNNVIFRSVYNIVTIKRGWWNELEKSSKGIIVLGTNNFIAVHRQ